MYSHPILPTLLELGDAVSRNLGFVYPDDIRLSYGEETITESNLLAIQRRHPEIVQILTFSKPQEALNGSDWEWAIIGNQLTLRMRIQAKRIDKKGSLRGLNRKAKTATLSQMDALIKGAEQEDILPVYCFYSADKHRSHWNSSADEFHYGCLIADARKIKKLKNKNFQSVETNCVPWHFLFSKNSFERCDYWHFAASDSVRFLRRSRIRISKKSIRLDDIKNPFTFDGRPFGTILNDSHGFDREGKLPMGLFPTSDEGLKHWLSKERDREHPIKGIITIDLRNLDHLK